MLYGNVSVVAGLSLMSLHALQLLRPGQVSADCGWGLSSLSKARRQEYDRDVCPLVTSPVTKVGTVSAQCDSYGSIYFLESRAILIFIYFFYSHC